MNILETSRKDAINLKKYVVSVNFVASWFSLCQHNQVMMLFLKQLLSHVRLPCFGFCGLTSVFFITVIPFFENSEGTLLGLFIFNQNALMLGSAKDANSEVQMTLIDHK